MEEREKEKKIGEEWLKGKEEKKNAKRERERRRGGDRPSNETIR